MLVLVSDLKMHDCDMNIYMEYGKSYTAEQQLLCLVFTAAICFFHMIQVYRV